METFRFDGESRELSALAGVMYAVIRTGPTTPDRSSLAAIRLAVHEVVVNTMRHAYAGRNGPIDVSISPRPDGLFVRVTDWGRRPTRPPARELPAEPQAHGYGLPIVHAVARSVSYSRSDGANHWDLEFAYDGDDPS